MNRSTFFKAIAGGVAAAVGIKCVPKAWSLPDMRGKFCRPMTMVDLRMAYATIKTPQPILPLHMTRLQRAIAEEASHIESVSRKMIAESNNYLINRIPDKFPPNMGDIT